MSAVRRKNTQIGSTRKTMGAAKPSAARKPFSPNPTDIAMRAYYIWQSKGCPTGQELENWLEAEAQLKL